MTDVSRGARSRRGGRGPGSLLLTGLLVLAIVASSTLVFTNKVELLRLAVVLSLWAAVLAAFVTVIYRRQSEVAQARARDMKFVYDLQLDREISARREYELSVEAQLRRQLSREVRAQAADEMAALRAELASLRSHLEVLLGTDLAPRPALESERIAVPMPAAPGRVESSRITVVAEEVVTVSDDETAIIDVPEEPLVPEPVTQAPVEPPPAQDYRPPRWRPEPQPAAFTPPPPQPETPWRPPEVRLGRHTGQPQRPEPPVPAEPVPAPESARGRHWVPAEPASPAAGRHRGAPEPAPRPAVEESTSPDADEDSQGQHAAGQSISDLLSKLNVSPPVGGGGRRRRED